MASTNKYTRRELEDIIFAVLEAGGDSPAKILGDWGALRAKLHAAGLPDPGAMNEAELFAMLTRMEPAGDAPSVGETAPVLAFKMRGAGEFEPFEYYDVIRGAEPLYADEWPVLAVDAATGALKAAIPRELVPYLDPQGLKLTVGVEVIQLSPDWLKEQPARGDNAPPDMHPTLGSEQGGSKTTVPTAAAQVSIEVAQALLARRKIDGE